MAGDEKVDGFQLSTENTYDYSKGFSRSKMFIVVMKTGLPKTADVFGG